MFADVVHPRVELLGEDEVGGRAGDGDEAPYGGGVGDAERQAFADHVVPLGGILGVSAHLHPLHIGDFNGDLEESKQTTQVNVRSHRCLNVISKREESLVAS